MSTSSHDVTTATTSSSSYDAATSTSSYDVTTSTSSYDVTTSTSSYDATTSNFRFQNHLNVSKIMLFLTCYTVATVTSEVKKINKTYSLIIGHLFDTIIVAATNKNLLY